MALPNPGMNFTPFDTLPASDLNDIVENIEALANGTALSGVSITSPVLVTPVLADFDGWNSPNGDTWVYASASTFTVAGNKTAKYRKGTRLKFIQGGVTKYLVIVNSTYSAPNTIVTIAVNTDFVLANSAITGNFYSYELAPVGYPTYFNYVPTWTNFTPGGAAVDARFSYNGGIVMASVKVKLNSSTMGTNPRFTLPIEGNANLGSDEGYVISRKVRLLDQGVTQMFGVVRMVPNSTTLAQVGVEMANGTFVQSTDLSATNPFTWGNTDVIFMVSEYEPI